MLLPARKDIDVVLEDLNNTYGLNFRHYPLMHNNFDLSEFESEYSPEKIWVLDYSHEGCFPYEDMEKLHKLCDRLNVNRKRVIFINNDQKIKENYKKWDITTLENHEGSLRNYARLNNIDYLLIETVGQRNMDKLENRVKINLTIIKTTLTSFNMI